MGLGDFRDHIELVEGAHGEGAYIDRRTSEWIGAGPGDGVNFTYELFFFDGHSEITTVALTVAAVYEDLYNQYLDPYWCTFQQEIAPNAMGDLPPAPLLLDSRLFQDDPELFHEILEHRWFMGEQTGEDVATADAVDDYVAGELLGRTDELRILPLPEDPD